MARVRLTVSLHIILLIVIRITVLRYHTIGTDAHFFEKCEIKRIKGTGELGLPFSFYSKDLQSEVDSDT